MPNGFRGVNVSADMKLAIYFSFVSLLLANSVWAQETPPDIRPEISPKAEDPAQPEPDPDNQGESELEGVLNTGPDYSQLTPEKEKAARLDALFERLKGADEESGKLIAEEIWALWLDSGSASVNMILLRGTSFENQGDYSGARRMYDHVTTLLPEYAEGWARSARLAYLEEDFNRALIECARALIYEPREFYALWTMGNVLEKLGRTDQAFETYKEAIDLYPEHPAIKARVEMMQTQLDGAVL